MPKKTGGRSARRPSIHPSSINHHSSFIIHHSSFIIPPSPRSFATPRRQKRSESHDDPSPQPDAAKQLRKTPNPHL
jgi:hypothetical protein